MRLWDLIRYALSSCVAIALLAGCSSSQPPIDAPGTTPQGLINVAQRRGPGESLMLSKARSGDLLYVSNGPNDVRIFTFPDGQPAGAFTTVAYPGAQCADEDGDVYIVDREAYKFDEFAHGGSSPVGTLSFPEDYFVEACSIDPRTGNMAVSGFDELYPKTPSVLVFKHARGVAKEYTDPDVLTFYECGYDGDGNLFVAAEPQSGGPAFLELRRRSSVFTKISMPANVGYGGVQWDGEHLAVGGGPRRQAAIYQLRIRSSNAVIVNTTELQDKFAYPTFVVHDGRAVVYIRHGGLHYLGIWAYPTGGKPITTIPADDFNQKSAIGGFSVSVAPH